MWKDGSGLGCQLYSKGRAGIKEGVPEDLATVAEQAQKSYSFLAMLNAGEVAPQALQRFEPVGGKRSCTQGLNRPVSWLPGAVGASSGCPSRQNQLQQATHDKI